MTYLKLSPNADCKQIYCARDMCTYKDVLEWRTISMARYWMSWYILCPIADCEFVVRTYLITTYWWWWYGVIKRKKKTGYLLTEGVYERAWVYQRHCWYVCLQIESALYKMDCVLVHQRKTGVESGRGGCGGQIVNVLAFYSYNPILNPAEDYS